MMTAIDLFAGCGGLSLGLKWAGWKIACVVERSPMAAETYYANFIYGDDKFEVDARYASHIGKSVPDQVKAGLLVDDIRTFRNHIASVNEVLGGQEIALLAGGPPCQGFSIAGKRNASDPRNDLVWRFLEAAELLLPPLVMLENVGAIQSPFEKGRQESVLPDLERALHLTGMAYGGYSTARLVLVLTNMGTTTQEASVPRWST